MITHQNKKLYCQRFKPPFRVQRPPSNLVMVNEDGTEWESSWNTKIDASTEYRLVLKSIHSFTTRRSTLVLKVRWLWIINGGSWRVQAGERRSCTPFQTIRAINLKPSSKPSFLTCLLLGDRRMHVRHLFSQPPLEI